MTKEEVEVGKKVRVIAGGFNVTIREIINDNEVKCDWYTKDRLYQEKVFNINELSVINNNFNLKYKRL